LVKGIERRAFSVAIERDAAHVSHSERVLGFVWALPALVARIPFLARVYAPSILSPIVFQVGGFLGGTDPSGAASCAIGF
jgi:hypothetical protein